MRNCGLFPFLPVLLVMMILSTSVDVVASQKIYQSNCLNGTIADCFIRDEEFLMESQVSRRLLQSEKPNSISYGAVRDRDKGVCKGPNPAYRSCLPGANQGSDRGCESVNRCRRPTK
ncbi:hypothetical protein L1049_005712 [Liquidambar formosana]|uniref:Uncharacterized protein n=1 Tax=Liquidambar formosana TaxID=63359 RepID=A0AAP0RGA5_LIQFO